MVRLITAFLVYITCTVAYAQAQSLTVGTITRTPFSFEEDGDATGFSIDLWAEVAAELGLDYQIQRFEDFGSMLGAVEAGEVDLSIANISITSAREEKMDFSHPIFESGLQVMIPVGGDAVPSVWKAFLSKDLLLAIVAAFALLFGGGMMMWAFERKAQPYFDLPAKDAMFPSFWWALNLVVNGGFEERMPRSAFGRIFGVILVVSSLFIVSVFVARITAVMTVEAINTNVSNVSDLYGKNVGTITGSTAGEFLQNRDIHFEGFSDLDALKSGFEGGRLDAVVFDAPILAYYVINEGKEIGELTGPVFLRENYGIALPSDSPLKEEINRSLLQLRENGRYDALHSKWFGSLN